MSELVVPQPSIPQLIPTSTCLTCRTCCHFPDRFSPLRPYFTQEERKAAVAAGVDPAAFPTEQGGRIRVLLHDTGYLCPAYETATGHCRIYARRPLDCRLYPFMIMWDEEYAGVVLGWDTTCPYTPSAAHALDQRAGDIVALIEKENRDTIAASPDWISPYLDTVRVLQPLPRLTAAVAGHAIRPLTPASRGRLAGAVDAVDTPLAAYALAPHLLWSPVLPSFYTEREGFFYLFADSPDGRFMPLPPLGPLKRLPEAIGLAFTLLTAHNGVSPVSRIENIPASMLGAFVEAGCVVTKKDPDYLYRSADLATLAGDRYKSQRAACNHLLRRHTVRYDPYRDADLDDALGLFRRWRSQQEARGIDAATAHMLYDAEHAHRYALEHHRELGLDGRVVRVDESLAAYTFGYARSRSIFCVLLEIADRGVPGLGAFVFRQFSREIADRGYTHINTMDDSGLSGLAQSKRAYRPVEMVQSYIATKP